MPVKILIAGVIFIISALTGFWLKKLGLPPNTAVFTVHKLLALAGVVLGILGFIGLLKTGSGGGTAVLLAVAAAVFAAALIATGAFMSLQKTPNLLLNNLHFTATLLLIADLAAVTFIPAFR